MYHTGSVSRRFPGGKLGSCCNCCRRKWLSRVSCEVCLARRSFSSIRSLFKAVSFAFTLTNLVASFRCFSRHLHSFDTSKYVKTSLASDFYARSTKPLSIHTHMMKNIYSCMFLSATGPLLLTEIQKCSGMWSLRDSMYLNTLT